jgi:transcriptional regulator with XRE-family HTH domain
MKPPIQNILRIREEKNLSREYVAGKLKLGESNYGKIERGEIGLTLDRLYEIAAVLKVQPEEILSYGKTKKGNVTYVPIEAQAGFLLGHTQERIENFKTYHLPFIEGNNLYMIDASGDSMFPTITHGDHLVIEQVVDIKILRYGRPHVIVAKDGIVIKRIHSHQSNKKYLLKSDNAIYEPYEIFKDDILSMWLVRDYKITSLFKNLPYAISGNNK